MAITKEKKKAIIDTLSDVAKDAKTVVFVGAHGLPVNDTNALRGELREGGVKYMVAKKTLMKRAFEASDIEGEFPTLEGEVAIAYTADKDASDVIAPARGVRSFEKKFGDNVAILGGVFEGTYKTKEEMTEIASIPSLDVLRGMFVNVINSPIQGLAVALSQIAEKKEA